MVEAPATALEASKASNEEENLENDAYDNYNKEEPEEDEKDLVEIEAKNESQDSEYEDSEKSVVDESAEDEENPAPTDLEEEEDDTELSTSDEPEHSESGNELIGEEATAAFRRKRGHIRRSRRHKLGRGKFKRGRRRNRVIKRRPIFVRGKGRLRITSRCSRYKRCMRTKCSRARLCGRRLGYCAPFVNCLCNRRMCKVNFKKFCKPTRTGLCKRFIRCARRKCRRRNGIRKKLCKCEKMTCYWKYQAKCRKFPRRLYDLGLVQNENMAFISSEIEA